MHGIVSSLVESSGFHGFQWTLTGLGLDSQKRLAVQRESSGLTGLDSSELGIVPANLAWQNGHWNPVESSGVHIDYMGEGKNLPICDLFWVHT